MVKLEDDLSRKRRTANCRPHSPFHLFPFSDIPSNFFSSDLVVLESICYRTRTKRPINDNNTTGGLRKISTGYERKKTNLKPTFDTRSHVHFLLSFFLSNKTGAIKTVSISVMHAPIHIRSSCLCCLIIIRSHKMCLVIWLKDSRRAEPHIFFCHPVVLQSICHHDCYTTGWMKKIGRV